MAQLGQNALVAAKHSQLAPVILGSQSTYDPRGWESHTAFVIDENVSITPQDGTPTFGSDVRFRLNKNQTLTGRCVLEVTLTGATLDAGQSAAYVKNLGDQILANVQVRYGSNILQNFTGEFMYMWRRLTMHDNHIETTNAQILGGLPAGGASETSRETALVQGLVLYVPLEELYWVWSRDEHWMPEAHAQELEVIISLAPLGRIIYSNDGTDPFDAGGVAPTIQQCRLLAQQVTTSASEKKGRLALHETSDGLIEHFLDLERQENQRLEGTGGAGTQTYTIKLDNIRMDMAEIMFWVREDSSVAGTPGVRNDWAGDAVESSSTVSTVTGSSINTLTQISSFRLLSNGQEIVRPQTDLYNRTEVRKRYHPDAQVADFIYCIPFALFPEDRKNATGHLPASNLGNLELEITMNAFAVAAPKRVDIYVHSHNLIQHRDGNVTKVLN